jgi:hypothetical protein
MTEVLPNRMTAEELRRKAEETAIVLLPVALTEQHGRHLAHQAAFLAPWRWGLKLDTPRSPSGPPPVCTGPSRDRQFANDCIAWARIATSDDQREQFLVPPRPKASHCHSFRLCLSDCFNSRRPSRRQLQAPLHIARLTRRAIALTPRLSGSVISRGLPNGPEVRGCLSCRKTASGNLMDSPWDVTAS